VPDVWCAGAMPPNALQERARCRERFLGDLTEPRGRRERCPGAQMYVPGVSRDGERTSLEPIASRSAGAVDEVPRPWALMVADLCREPDVWSRDATAFPNAGTPAVGVAQPSCGTLDKVAHGHVAVSVPWRSPASRWPLTWRLYGPQAWSAALNPAGASPGTTGHCRRRGAWIMLRAGMAWGGILMSGWSAWPLLSRTVRRRVLEPHPRIIRCSMLPHLRRNIHNDHAKSSAPQSSYSTDCGLTEITS
jgi:hypothetical protein